MAESLLRDGPLPKHHAPVTPRSIKEKTFMQPVPPYKPHLYGGNRTDVSAVFGGSLGKWSNTITHDANCEHIGPPEQVELDYNELLSLSAALMEHHFEVNDALRSRLKSPLIAQRFGESFGCLAIARVLYMVHCELSGKASDGGHPVAQLLQLEALGIDCPEPILRMAQVIGLLNVSGCTYTPARPEEMAIKLCVRAAINLVAVDSEGELLEQAELEQLWRLVEKAPMGADGWLCAPNKPLLSECWEETAKVLSERASNATTVEVPCLLTSVRV